MADINVKLLQGTEAKMAGEQAPAIKNGQLYFATIDEGTKGYIYLDSNGKRFSFGKYAETAGYATEAGAAENAKRAVSADTAGRLQIPILTSNILTTAVSQPAGTSALYFVGSNAITAVGSPANNSFIKIYKNENNNVLIDCYEALNGNHWINSNPNATSATSGWTGWIDLSIKEAAKHWETPVTFQITDGVNDGMGIAVDGSQSPIKLPLPNIIKATLNGNADSATQAGKLTTARQFTIGDTGKDFNGENPLTWTPSEIGYRHEWNATIQGQTWSRLCQVNGGASVVGSSFMLNIAATRGNVVYNDTFLIKSYHQGAAASRGSIIKIAGSEYTVGYSVRLLTTSNGAAIFEIKDNAQSIATGTAQTVNCRLIPIFTGAITKYTTFTSGATLPSGYEVTQEMVLTGTEIQANVEGSFKGDLTGNATSATTASTAAKVNHTLSTNTKYSLSGTTLTASGASDIVFDTGIYTDTTPGHLVVTGGIDNTGALKQASGHLYLTGAQPASSTGNTTQIVFGTDSNQHVALSSNSKLLVINPTTSTITNQILFYLDQASKIPSGLQVGSAITPITTGQTSLGTTALKFSDLHLSGGANVGGNLTVDQKAEIKNTLVLSKTQDASGKANNEPALIVGGTATTAHIEIDNNEILAKTNGTTPTTLNLNTDGGATNMGGAASINGKLTLAGNIAYTNVNGSNNYNDYEMIKFIPGANDGAGMVIGGGGAVIIGSGESASAYQGTSGANIAGNSETMAITADSSINFVTNCQTIANRVQVSLDGTRQFYPVVAIPSGDTRAAAGSLGTNTQLWKTAYIESIYATELFQQDGAAKVVDTIKGGTQYSIPRFADANTIENSNVIDNDTSLTYKTFIVPNTNNTSGTVGSISKPIYINAGTISEVTGIETSVGGTGSTSYQENRMIRSNEDADALISTNHYANDTQFAVNSTEIDDTLTFYVGGNSKISGELNVTGNVDFDNNLNVDRLITQGGPTSDTSIDAMNKFKTDLFVEGSGAAPNAPTIPGFYLGKSATDGNRHMDIVSGENVSYIDFNKASHARDFDFRIHANVSNGLVNFQWGDHSELTDKRLKINGLTEINSTHTTKNALKVTGGAKISNTLRIGENGNNSNFDGEWCEGIRINADDGEWVTIALGATGETSKNTHMWSIHRTNTNKFAIAKNGSAGLNGLVLTSIASEDKASDGKMGLGTADPVHRLHVVGDARVDGTLYLQRQGGTHAGRINFYHDTTHKSTWVEYMSNIVDKGCPTGGTPSTYGDVTTWARRSLIESSQKYGWIWEACTASHTGTPTPIMSLSSNTGKLKVKGIIETENNLSVAGTTTLNNTLTVTTGGAQITGNSKITGALEVTGRGSFAGLTSTAGNNFICSGNEFNFIPDSYSNPIYINCQTVSRNSTGAVSSYVFLTGNGTTNSYADIQAKNANFSGTLTVAGASTFTGKITANGGIQGNLTGTATKATQDGDGNVITSTYVKKAGDTMTGDLMLENANPWIGFTDTNATSPVKAYVQVAENSAKIGMGFGWNKSLTVDQNGMVSLVGSRHTDDGTTGSLHLNNSNILGVNSIYTADAAGDASEGIQFYRTATTVDSLWAAGGVLYFTQGRTISDGSSGTTRRVIHSGSNPSVANVIISSASDDYSKYFKVENTTSGAAVSLMVGSGATNRGVYDSVLDKWIIYSDGTDARTQLKLYGAVWNDYAEFRKAETIEPGRIVVEHESGEMKLSSERLQAGANVTSDTFGFAIGETDECKTPIAVAGRALVYTYEDRNSYPLGAAVCAGPGGTVSLMTREEIREWPDRIIGTVSEIPKYETWGEDSVPVNGRIWIKVR